MAEDSIAVVRSPFDAFNQGDLDSAAAGTDDFELIKAEELGSNPAGATKPALVARGPRRTRGGDGARGRST
jgi:hypothetical protein